MRAVFQTTGAHLDLFDQLRHWLRYWSEIEKLVEDMPGLWLASVTRGGVSIFDGPAEE